MTTLLCACGHPVSAVTHPAAVQGMADHLVAVHQLTRAGAM